jgi:hypothetical protein
MIITIRTIGIVRVSLSEHLDIIYNNTFCKGFIKK